MTKERSLLQESNNKLVRDVQMLQSEQEHLEKTNDKLNKENKNKMNLISQLEKVFFQFFWLVLRGQIKIELS